MLRVGDVIVPPKSPPGLVFDWYVPISYSADCSPKLGIKYIMVGNRGTETLLLKKPLTSMNFCECVLTGADLSQPRLLDGDGPRAPGIPVLELPAGAKFSGGDVPRADVAERVFLRCQNRLAEIGLGEARAFDRRLAHGRVDFLLNGDRLVGMRINDLTPNEEDGLREYIERHQ